MAGIFRKAFGGRQKMKPATEKHEPSGELSVKDRQSVSVNMDLIDRPKTLKQDIHAAVARTARRIADFKEGAEKTPVSPRHFVRVGVRT